MDVPLTKCQAGQFKSIYSHTLNCFQISLSFRSFKFAFTKYAHKVHQKTTFTTPSRNVLFFSIKVAMFQFRCHFYTVLLICLRFTPAAISLVSSIETKNLIATRLCFKINNSSFLSQEGNQI